MAKDYRKLSLDRVTGVYANLSEWVDHIGEILDESEMRIEGSDGLGGSATIQENIDILYNFAKLGAMANVTGYTEELEKHEKAMLQEEES